MNTEGDASGAQGSGQPRRSPRVALQGQQQLNTYKRKDRKKRLRLPTPQPDVDSEVHEEQEGQDNEQRAQDSDFDPARDAEGGGDDDTGADGDAANVVGQKRRRKQPPAIRCSPSKFQELLKALPADLEARVRANGFGGLLGFKPSYLDRKLLTWLMLRLNPETMKLELGGGKEIAITEHTIWCVFQLPKAGGDPAFMSDAEARIRRNELGEQICPSTYKRLGIRIMDIVDGLKSKTFTGDLGLRAFFMGVFHSLLFSNTDSRIRLEDVIYTEDLANIGKINWCKAVVDNLSKAARLYRKDFATKSVDAPITSCGIFLMRWIAVEMPQTMSLCMATSGGEVSPPHVIFPPLSLQLLPLLLAPLLLVFCLLLVLLALLLFLRELLTLLALQLTCLAHTMTLVDTLPWSFSLLFYTNIRA